MAPDRDGGMAKLRSARGDAGSFGKRPGSQSVSTGSGGSVQSGNRFGYAGPPDRVRPYGRCHLDAGTVCSVTFVHSADGSKADIPVQMAAVRGPRSRCQTSPAASTMNVCTPDAPYVAGHASTAKPP